MSVSSPLPQALACPATWLFLACSWFKISLWGVGYPMDVSFCSFHCIMTKHEKQGRNTKRACFLPRDFPCAKIVATMTHEWRNDPMDFTNVAAALPHDGYFFDIRQQHRRDGRDGDHRRHGQPRRRFALRPQESLFRRRREQKPSPPCSTITVTV